MCQRLHQNDAQNKINLSNNAWIEKTDMYCSVKIREIHVESVFSYIHRP